MHDSHLEVQTRVTDIFMFNFKFIGKDILFPYKWQNTSSEWNKQATNGLQKNITAMLYLSFYTCMHYTCILHMHVALASVREKDKSFTCHDML